MNVKRILVSGLLTYGALLSAATVLEPKSVEEFRITGRPTLQNGVFILKKEAVFIKPTPINTAKKYQLSATLRVRPGTKVPKQILLRGWCVDKNNRQIFPWMVRNIAGTETVLAKDAKKGDTSITLQNGAKWQNKYNFYGIVFNAKADFSDLPNASYARLKAKTLKRTPEGFWTIQLQTPLSATYAKGTPVREHISGKSYMDLLPITPTTQWKDYKGRIATGMLKSGCSDDKFSPGTKGITLMVGITGGDKSTVIEIKNLKLEEK